MILVAASSPIAAMTRKEYPDVAGRILGPDANLHGLDPTRQVVVDNADLFLGFQLQHSIAGITVTGRVENIWTNPFLNQEDVDPILYELSVSKGDGDGINQRQP